MKKIGILTFHIANNYGAVLQAYALKTVLKNLGANPQIVNYLSPKIVKDYKLFSGIRSINDFIKKLFLPKIIINNNKFNNFRKKYLIDTIALNPKDINNIMNEYDAFITGSDQVFNMRNTNFDSNYLLSFVKQANKKYSYAASLGMTELSVKERIFLKEHLNDFSKISVREKQAAKIINSLTNKEVLTHLDPTLLLNKEQWNKLSKCNEKGDYILVYLMSNNDRVLSFAKKLAKEKKLKLINISLNFLNRTQIKTISPKPEEWLGYFLKARYIVTNSFHGLCFSINFNKQFFADFLPNTLLVNSRLENLLDLTNLRDRLIDNIGTNYDKPIDWNSVNETIEEEKEKSLSYLKSIVL